MGKLTQRELKELLIYSPKTGIFINNKNRGSQAVKGQISGGYNAEGYHKIKLAHNSYYSHVLAWLYMKGYFPENDIDHIDGDKGNNKFSNLRHVSRQCNVRNQGLCKNNTSGITGVSWAGDRGKWGARIGINRVEKHLGFYVEKYNAVKARWEAEVKHGFPDCNSTSPAYLYLKCKGSFS